MAAPYQWFDDARSTASARSSGAPTLTLADATKFGASGAWSTPALISVRSGGMTIVVLVATGRTGNVLSISGAAPGWTDAPTSAGASALNAITKRDMELIWAAIDAAGGTPGPTGPTGPQGPTGAAGVSKWSMVWTTGAYGRTAVGAIDPRPRRMRSAAVPLRLMVDCPASGAYGCSIQITVNGSNLLASALTLAASATSGTATSFALGSIPLDAIIVATATAMDGLTRGVVVELVLQESS